MRPIELNLASNPYRNDAPLTVGLGVLLVLALAFTGFNAYAYLTADGTKDRLEAQLASHRATMDAMRAESETIREELAAVDAEVLGAQATFVAGILAQRNFSWTALLNALEEVLPWNVRLSVIRPEFGSMGRVTLALRGTARDVDAFYDLQEALEGSSFFSEVVPGNWQYANRDAMRDDTVEFVLTCRYERVAADAAEGEVRRAGLPLDDEEGAERIVVEGESLPAPAETEDAGLGEALPDEEPGVAESRPAPNAPRRGPSAASRSGAGARSRAGRDSASSDAPPETRRERRARRQAAGLAAGTAVGGAPARAGRPASPQARSAAGATAPAGPGAARRGPAGSAGNQGGATGSEAAERPERMDPADTPLEELVEVDENGVKHLRLKPAPERPARANEEDPEQSKETPPEAGSGAGSGGGGSGSGGSGSGSSGSGGSGSGSSGGRP